MPSFTEKSINLIESGPTCRVVISLSATTIEVLKLEKKDVPKINVLALIDTGASSTGISQKVVDTLKLVSRGTTNVATSSTSSEQRNEYDISMTFDNDVHVDLIRAIEARLDTLSIDCIIGRDVLQHGILIYNGCEKQFTLSF